MTTRLLLPRILLTAFALCLTVGGGRQAAAAPPSGWPAELAAEDGFGRVGRAIADEPGFPRTGTQIEKAKYVYGRIPAVAGAYGLQANRGTAADNALVGAGRFNDDPEGTGALKTTGVGNCAEWTYAMLEMLGGAGVEATPYFADSTRENGASLGFNGTDTSLYVNERTSDRKVSRRVFDAFRACHHGTGGRPTTESLEEWGDRPLTDVERLPQDQGICWLQQVKKPYIKSAFTEELLPSPHPNSWPTRESRRISSNPARPAQPTASVRPSQPAPAASNGWAVYQIGNWGGKTTFGKPAYGYLVVAAVGYDKNPPLLRSFRGGGLDPNLKAEAKQMGGVFPTKEAAVKSISSDLTGFFRPPLARFVLMSTYKDGYIGVDPEIQRIAEAKP
jgi:hypothetical protein